MMKNRLKELRKEKGVTQQDVADYMGITRRGYQKWENGESAIKPNRQQKLADYFGVTVAHLLGYTPYFENASPIRKEKKFAEFAFYMTVQGFVLTDKQLKTLFNLATSFSSDNTLIHNLLNEKPSKDTIDHAKKRENDIGIMRQLWNDKTIQHKQQKIREIYTPSTLPTETNTDTPTD